MINTRRDLREYLARDMQFYYAWSKWERFICWLTKDPVYYIAKYIRLLRREEYYANSKKGKWGTFLYLYFFRRKNILGNRIGFKIPKNCFGPGLTIYHHGTIIINEDARIGADCKLHGENCIGNNARENTVPKIGDGLDLGVGAKIIGNVTLGNQVIVGANAVVTRSNPANDIILVGIPASELKQGAGKDGTKS